LDFGFPIVNVCDKRSARTVCPQLKKILADEPSALRLLIKMACFPKKTRRKGFSN